MPETRLIGLVGGLGPAATIHYYRGLLAECARRSVTLRLLINQATTELVLDAAARGDHRTLADHLAARMEELERAGAELLAIAAVMPHMCLPELAQRTSTSIIDIVATTDAELARRGIARVALMGTRATVESRLFGRLNAAVADPRPDQVSRVHDLYLSIVRLGRVEPDTENELQTLARDYIDGLGIEAIVLAGTELALASPRTWQGLKTVDCAALHIDAIVTASLPK